MSLVALRPAFIFRFRYVKVLDSCGRDTNPLRVYAYVRFSRCWYSLSTNLLHLRIQMFEFWRKRRSWKCSNLGRAATRSRPLIVRLPRCRYISVELGLESRPLMVGQPHYRCLTIRIRAQKFLSIGYRN